jgi:four helix bundle protein
MAEAKIENRKTKSGPQPAMRVKDFTDLDAWKLARELRLAVYRLSRQFPTEERQILTAQIRRAAISTTANLAEGYGRYSYQENSQFCRQSRASAYEVRDHLTTALDQGYISQIAWKDADNLARRVIQVLNGYIRATQRRRQETEDT